MSEQLPPDEPTTLDEFLWYCRRYEDSIYVRHKLPSGKYDAVSLGSLEPKDWAHWVAQWLDEGRIPVRILEDPEQESGTDAEVSE